MGEIVLVDTSALYAIAATDDRSHDSAQRQYARMLDDGSELNVSSYVLVETIALVQRRLGYQALLTFGEAVLAGFRTHWVDAQLHASAWALMASRPGNALSFVDWSTVVLAKELRATVFAFDRRLMQEVAQVSS